MSCHGSSNPKHELHNHLVILVTLQESIHTFTSIEKQPHNFYTLKKPAYLFGLLLIVFIPFEIFPYQQALTDFLFKNPLTAACRLFGREIPFNPQISSDSILLYYLALLLLILACVLSLTIHFIPALKNTWPQLKTLLNKLFAYYLAFILFKYGFDKLFKAQFYLPEPNTLFTPFGQLDQDILYWSTIGTSHSYNLFLGTTEVLAALLLLFNRTRATGLFLSLGIIINVLAINICFDISVKLFSLVLLYLSLLGLLPHLTTFVKVFILKKNVAPYVETPGFALLQHPLSRAGLKSLVIIFIFVQCFLPYAAQGNYNDDLAPRPYLHGAYEITNIKPVSDSAESAEPLIKRIFFHRAGFLIFQDKNDAMKDYKLEVDLTRHKLLLKDYNSSETELHFVYSVKDSTLEMQYFFKGKEYLLQAKAINWRKLPALQRQFHITMDSQE